MNFTYLSHKTSHASPSKTMYIYTFAIVAVHIYTVTVTLYTIILLISFIFSLSSLCAKQPSSSFSSDTYKHIHTNKSTQRYTNTPIQTNQ